MKYGLLTYQEGKEKYNVGDYVQSLAARQFLPQVDQFMNREKLGEYKGDPIQLIMNGWFTHNIHHWVPSEEIDPLMVSFHMNSTAAPFMLSEKGIAYLKKHGPIGCRDKYTVKILKEKGIEAYFTGCLTLTLDNYKVDDSERGDDIYIVDPFYNYPTSDKLFLTPKHFVKGVLKGDAFNLNKIQKQLKKVVDEDLLTTAKYVTQILPTGKQTDEEKFEYAEECLKKYAKAKLVITSRIHCALPCLAMGTPVIFLNAFNTFVDTCRFDGIAELFNRVDVADDGSFTANFDLPGKINRDTMVTNLGLHHALAEPLKEKCRNFIKTASAV
ncbi:polysaccharide pyruvyl transferase family protein [Aquimarina sp. 2201CG5-10]|uniref:polysaccharide pyruvyl transferase family protein n=1 Tax=Aquimarina callyspongiae TaxID=3098150 RepID=UPI002AB3F10D|nr:polysaccharide pyruvyl transferase family protein [Aquimarina sp. 2201CG5-10]MDY8136297.1 polysaccharide pyruvyl transferase family protein [Aquimarina sp. 2201CG5-10]